MHNENLYITQKAGNLKEPQIGVVCCSIIEGLQKVL